LAVRNAVSVLACVGVPDLLLPSLTQRMHTVIHALAYGSLAIRRIAQRRKGLVVAKKGADYPATAG
jgi:hypothetical protein